MSATHQGGTVKIPLRIANQPTHGILAVRFPCERVEHGLGAFRRHFENGSAAFVASRINGSTARRCTVEIAFGVENQVGTNRNLPAIRSAGKVVEHALRSAGSYFKNRAV